MAFIDFIALESLEFELKSASILFEEYHEGNYDKAMDAAINLKSEIEKSKFSPSIKDEYLVLIHHLIGRILTRQHCYAEALKLFEDNRMISADHYQIAPLDLAIRDVSGSYEALCLYHTGDHERARVAAESTLERLQKLSKLSFHSFAEEKISIVSLPQ